MKGIDLIIGIEGQGRGKQFKCERSRSLLIALCLLFLFPLMMAPSVVGQTTTSTIEGTVKDAQGSVVSGAQIVAKSEALGVERSTNSDANWIAGRARLCERYGAVVEIN